NEDALNTKRTPQVRQILDLMAANGDTIVPMEYKGGHLHAEDFLRTYLKTNNLSLVRVGVSGEFCARCYYNLTGDWVASAVLDSPAEGGLFTPDYMKNP